MSDLISRQAAIDIVMFECGKWTGLAKEISKQIKQLPSVQPDYTMRCSFCDMSICTLEGRPCSRKVVKEGDNKFCPNCGARMLKGGDKHD